MHGTKMRVVFFVRFVCGVWMKIALISATVRARAKGTMKQHSTAISSGIRAHWLSPMPMHASPARIYAKCLSSLARARNTQIPYGLISVSFRAEIVGYAAVGLRAYFAKRVFIVVEEYRTTFEFRFDVCVCCGIVLVVKYANDDVRCSWALIDFD